MRHSMTMLRIILVFAIAAAFPARAADTAAQAEQPAATPESAGGITPAPTATTGNSEPVCMQCGTIVRIESQTQEGKATGVGAATGAVLGAIAGREIVSGSRGSRNAAAVAGAVGGGYAGHKIEENVRTENHYLVSVEMDSDSRIEIVKIESIEGWAAGDKVRIVEGQLYKR